VTAGLCECGCGGQTRLVEKSNSRKGHVKGQPYRFIHGHSRRPELNDDLAIAVHTGAADARNGRPRRVDHGDTSEIGAAYTRGYNTPDAWRYER
jgi:hypothetical protein